MYERYWNLRQSPFGGVTAAEEFYRGPMHEAALLKLRYAVERRHAAAVLLGPGGSGKTCVANRLAAELPPAEYLSVHLVFPQLSPAEFLSFLAAELGVAEPPGWNGGGALDRTLRRIRRQLAEETRRGRTTLLIVDEAHTIHDPRLFLTLQLLLNFRQPQQLHLCLLLIGEVCLLGQLRQVPALAERVAVTAVLTALDFDQTTAYLAHRLSAAGGRADLFDADALAALHEISGGIPRRIDQLADLALLVGHADGLQRITPHEIEAVAEELVFRAAA